MKSFLMNLTTILCSLLILVCCKNKNHDPNPSGESSNTFYIKGDLNGTAFDYTYGVNYISQTIELMQWKDTTNNSYLVLEGAGFRTISSTYLNIGIIDTFQTWADSLEVESMFYVGNYIYGNKVTAEPGVEIELFDGTDIWTTRGNQLGSVFEITEHKVDPVGYRYYNTHISSGNFSCLLYDGKGNSKSITSGTFRVRTVEIPSK